MYFDRLAIPHRRPVPPLVDPLDGSAGKVRINRAVQDPESCRGLPSLLNRVEHHRTLYASCSGTFTVDGLSLTDNFCGFHVPRIRIRVGFGPAAGSVEVAVLPEPSADISTLSLKLPISSLAV